MCIVSAFFQRVKNFRRSGTKTCQSRKQYGHDVHRRYCHCNEDAWGSDGRTAWSLWMPMLAWVQGASIKIWLHVSEIKYRNSRMYQTGPKAAVKLRDSETTPKPYRNAELLGFCQLSSQLHSLACQTYCPLDAVTGTNGSFFWVRAATNLQWHQSCTDWGYGLSATRLSGRNRSRHRCKSRGQKRHPPPMTRTSRQSRAAPHCVWW